MNFGLARTADLSAWTLPYNSRRTGSASTNASLTWTSNGATTSTTQKKFGTASEQLGTTSADIYSANTTIGGMGTSDFTIECFIYIDSLSQHSSSCDVYSHDTSYGMGFRLARSYNDNGLSGASPQFINIFARQQADLDYWTLPSNWPTGQWNFVVIQRKSGTMSCWVNGTLLTRTTGSGGTANGYNFDTGSAALRIGTADGSNGLGPNTLNSYIDEFCISNTYRYADTTVNIPIPTAAFTVDSYTVQLLHMDGTNGGTTFTNATS